MRGISSLQVLAAALLLASLTAGLPHEGADSMDMNMDVDMDMGATHNETMTTTVTEDGPMSYFAYPEHGSAILAHIILMVVAWCFILPIGKYMYHPTR
jgi:hypothetical protein